MVKKNLSMVALLPLMLAACGGDNSADDVSVDLVERECVDWNDNLSCDSGESASVVAQAGNTSARAARILETVDATTGQQLSVFLAPSDTTYVDAMTSLAWNEVAGNPFVENSDQARVYLSNKLNVNWDNTSAEYVTQEAALRRQLLSAMRQVDDPKLAISAQAESILAQGNLNADFDSERVADTTVALELLAQVPVSQTISSWNYSARRQQLIVATADNYLRLYDSRNGLKLTDNKQLIAGKESADASGSKQIAMAAQLQVGQGVDAFASATNVAPPVPPAPTTPPVTPPTSPTDPQPAERDLNPQGTIAAVGFSNNFANAFVLTRNAAASSDASSRACQTAETQYGVFKVNLFDTAGARVVAGCNQSHLSVMDVRDDGGNMLVFDANTQRLYWVSPQTMREANNHYLLLSSGLAFTSANPADEYAIVAEQSGANVYLVRLQDMLVLSGFGFAANELRDVHWQSEGDEVVLISDTQWQRWDIRALTAPVLLESGDLTASAAGGTLIAVSDNLLYYTRKNGSQLTVYRMDNHDVVGQLTDVEAAVWQASDLIVKTSSGFSRYQLHRTVLSPLQRADIYLTAARLAAGNGNLDKVESNLTLPANIPGTQLNISWSGSLQQMTYSGNNAGDLVANPTEERGTITATINSTYRGDAVRWKKTFEVHINPN